ILEALSKDFLVSPLHILPLLGAEQVELGLDEKHAARRFEDQIEVLQLLLDDGPTGVEYEDNGIRQGNETLRDFRMKFVHATETGCVKNAHSARQETNWNVDLDPADDLVKRGRAFHVGDHLRPVARQVGPFDFPRGPVLKAKAVRLPLCPADTK